MKQSLLSDLLLNAVDTVTLSYDLQLRELRISKKLPGRHIRRCVATVPINGLFDSNGNYFEIDL